MYDDYTEVVLDLEEGKRIAHSLGGHKAARLVGPPMAGWRASQPLHEWIVSRQPDLLEE